MCSRQHPAQDNIPKPRHPQHIPASTTHGPQTCSSFTLLTLTLMFSGTSNKVTAGLELVASQLSSNIIQLCSCWPVCYKEPRTAVMVLWEFRALDLKIHYLMCQYGIVHQHAHRPCLLQGDSGKDRLAVAPEEKVWHFEWHRCGVSMLTEAFSCILL